MKTICIVLCSLIPFIHAVNAAEQSPQVIERFALIIGANDGGQDRAKLRFATSDAESFAKVLEEMGGVEHAKRILLTEPNRQSVKQSIVALEKLVKATKNKDNRIELVFYYSGHSDELGLLLGPQRLNYQELREYISRIPADVRIAILDSCASGAFTRMKGGKRRPPFLLDSSSSVKGHAFLTSSSADEAAQESDNIGGSFFTHYLITGMRGAADLSSDGRITLNEAYQFAFYETLARTEKTIGGPQHPGYEFQLTGSGDLVLTDMRGTSASMVFNADMYGRLSIRNPEGHLVAELRKPPGRPIQLGVEPGKYTIVLSTPEQLYGTTVYLDHEGQIEIQPSTLHPVDKEFAIARGSQPTSEESEENNLQHIMDQGKQAVAQLDSPNIQAQAQKSYTPGITPPEAGYNAIPISFFIIPGLGTYISENKLIVTSFSLSLFGGRAARLYGIQLAGMFNWIDEYTHGMQWAGIANITGDKVNGGQASGIFNISGGELYGFQGSSIFNIAKGPVKGVQGAGVFNITGGNVQGVQGSGVFNIANGRVRGVQGAGIFNIADKEVRGIQASSTFNSAEKITGAQVSLVNISGDVNGGQVGIINIADNVKGFQVGLINISEDIQGVPIGLFNFVEKGQLHLEFWSNSWEYYNLGLKFGSRHVYTMFAGGFNPPQSSDAPTNNNSDELQWSLYLGIGGTINIGKRLYINVDGLAGSTHYSDITETYRNGVAKVRAQLGFSIFRHMSAFVGISGNMYVAYKEEENPIQINIPINSQATRREGDITIRVWPNVMAGIRF